VVVVVVMMVVVVRVVLDDISSLVQSQLLLCRTLLIRNKNFKKKRFSFPAAKNIFSLVG
jgi:hypothetical protein